MRKGVQPKLFVLASRRTIKPSFHMIAHDRWIAENTATDRQQLYGNTFQQSGNRQRSSPIISLAIVSDPTLQ